MPLRLIAVAAMIAVAVICCKPSKRVNLDSIERLNSTPGTLGLFSYPYYNSIYALAGGGAVAAWLRREGSFLPVMYRYAGSDAAVFGAEAYLSPEPFRQTVSIVPTIVAGGDDLYAVWQARQPTRGDKFVLFSRSRDRGATWSEEQPLNIGTGAFVPTIATASDGRIYVAWADERAGRRAVRFDRSLDGGATWLPEDVQISEAGRRLEAISVAIASDGGNRVLVVWDQSARGGRSIVATASADGGATWTAPVQVDDGSTGPSPASPAVVFAGGTPIVAWSAGSVAISRGVDAFGQVWGDVSRDGGTTWGKDVLIHETKGGALPTLQLTSDGSRAHVIFNAGPATGGTKIYVSSTDATPAWQADHVPKPISRSEGNFLHPRMAEDRRGMMFAVWEEDARRIHFTHSVDDATGGTTVTWSEDDEIVYEVEDPQNTEAHYPQVAAADGAAYVMWEVWGSLKGQLKTFVDIERKTRPADLYVRRVTVAR